MSGDVAGTNGGDGGAAGHACVTGGVPPLAFALCIAGPVAFGAINIWTRLHDQPGLAGRAWEVVTWEASSAAATIVLLPVVARIVRKATVALPAIGAALAWHVAGLLAFFGLHVGSFVLLRVAVYASMGSRYRFGGLGAWIYEFPKDGVSYLILAAIMSAALLRPRAATPAATRAGQPPVIPIREGTRTHYARPDEILAVSSAGNYVEWHLDDGRKPLTRASLAAVHTQLAPLGFVRTHRSWLVNRRRITAITATRSGDHQLTLAGGITVPGSRRYAAAFEVPQSEPAGA